MAKYTEEQRPKFTEVKRKAAVGERIKITKSGIAFRAGEIITVHKNAEILDDTIRFVNGKQGTAGCEYVVLEPVAEIQSDPLYESFRKFVAENADGLRRLLADIKQPALTIDSVGNVKAANITVTKPLSRAEVIANATADVAELTRKMSSGVPQVDGNYTFQHRITTPEFHVNREKRVVTVLVRHDYGNDAIVERAIAKCSPKDVFHAEIGKAIALRKALGLTVPTEYTNAPQPDEPRVGAIVQAFSYGGRALDPLTVRKVCVVDGKTQMYRNANLTRHCEYEPTKTGDHIIDDTDVNYAA